MAITRSFGSTGQFSVVDYTEELNIIPNSWGTIGSLGLFQEQSVAEHVVQFDKVDQSVGLVVDRIRGERNNVSKDYAREVHSFNIPHFPLTDYISPSDVQGRRAYGSADAAETLDAVRMRKMERIAKSLNWTLEAARAQALTLGTVYAPTGTVSQNWFTEFGITQTEVDFAFSTSTTDVIGKIETVIAAIQDNGGAISMSGVVVLCSPTWFAALVGHATTRTAFQYFAGQQDPLRARLSADGSAVPYHREFFYGGARFIEMRDTYNGSQLIPTNTAVAVPTGTDFFKTYFGPANRFFTANTLGERQYFFENPSQDGTEHRIDAETNFVNALMRPEVVIKLTKS